jgi:multidrug efflux pump subunit AcrA (membrane-fusion protein)
VVRVNKEQGESVLLNEVVARVVNMDRVYAQFYMRPEEAAMLQAGDVYHMRLVAGPSAGKICTGKVTLVDPVLDAESALVRVRVEVPNGANELRAGMRVEGGVAAPSS